MRKWGFENKADFPLQMEYDDHDDSAIPFIVRSRVTGQWVGTMRLISKKACTLPIEQNCKINEEI
ncbi:PEP-CTERM/exosortase system-associated acyltransferase, partial [Methylococcaceae bacterium CS1]